MPYQIQREDAEEIQNLPTWTHPWDRGKPGSAALTAICHDSIESNPLVAMLLLSQQRNKLYQKKHLCQHR